MNLEEEALLHPNHSYQQLLCAESSERFYYSLENKERVLERVKAQSLLQCHNVLGEMHGCLLYLYQHRDLFLL
jgi:hypothetical protein